MKIFWSWQSDTPGKTGRHFVRAALLDAVNELKTHPDIEEPTGRFDRDAIHLDSDRQGVPGSPDLAATIFAKIDAAAVVVVDVTPVGHGPVREGDDGTEMPRKALMNPNVAIELGYALGKHAEGSNNNLIMICNSFYGNRSDLPFDLAHKAGPIFYNLPPEAPKSGISSAHRDLKYSLVAALKPFLSLSTLQTVPLFVPTSAGANAGVWFERGAVLGQAGDQRFDSKLTNYYLEVSPIFYLRLVPSQALAEQRTRSDVRRIAHDLPHFSTTGGSFIHENAWGAANIEPFTHDGSSSAIVQLFLNGEIWAVNRSIVTRFPDGSFFYIGAVEMLLRKRLPSYIDAIIQRMNVLPPIDVEIGFVGVKGYRILLNQTESMGVIHADPAPIRVQLKTNQAEARSALLLTLFERMFLQLVQEHRPDNYNGFPNPSQPASFRENGY